VRFEQRLRDGLNDGSITVAFRRWRRVQVVAGHHYRTGAGMVAAESVGVVTADSITAAQARAAGYADRSELLADLRGDAGLPVYMIRFRKLSEPDPRDVLRTAPLTDADAAALAKRLARMDAGKHGPWTTAFLQLIADQPEVNSIHLAETLGWERFEFKLQVRRLKALGLTISYRIGYRLSPRGEAFLAWLRAHNAAETR
jgi:hypothetical protein